MKAVRLLNAMIYVTNKALYTMIGNNSRTLSRLASKYIINYLYSQNILNKEKLNEEELKKAFINEMGLSDDLIFQENGSTVVLDVINPVLRESIIQLNKENIPITLAPCIIYMYLISNLYGYKVEFQKVEYNEENNKTVWTFKKH
ncbi:MAG: hypothetical protein PWP15_910 [Methanothermococcus sp.]|jgi:hypothetical protein|uniref:Uncharacterized protein n=1 Tax=Methanococcus maripaludis KA1 TaxID=637914 RepID=A0A2Z5PHC4_METMI|nr:MULTISPECIES: hypothetical protein [Methanococcaceae]MDK2790403.1 hypothetical protein [Methanothermococcus sp.]MDK2987486.1 hypothetical protein [Methanothermococcus sp.]BAP61208.1 hypothetical protein MMKA1_10910 [Methanococcus maripaludis KA1]